jgi:hypothetical protein
MTKEAFDKINITLDNETKYLTKREIGRDLGIKAIGAKLF